MLPKRSRTNENIPRAKKAILEVTHDTFYCTVDGWQRPFEFGVNWRRGREIEKELGGGPYDDWDNIKVVGTVRRHVAHHKRSRGKFTKVDVKLYRTHIPREKWHQDPEAVGRVWTEKGVLHAGVFLAADEYYSLVPCFIIGHFKELVLQVRNLRQSKGLLYRIEFHPEETPQEDM